DVHGDLEVAELRLDQHVRRRRRWRLERDERRPDDCQRFHVRNAIPSFALRATEGRPPDAPYNPRMPIGSAVHERTLPLCESLNYREWSGYYCVSAYEAHHEHE